jgi:hypothetical protein
MLSVFDRRPGYSRRAFHRIGTIMHTLFDVAALRLRPDATGAVAKVITESEPFRGLHG